MKGWMRKTMLALTILGMVAVAGPRPASAVSFWVGVPGFSLFSGPPVVAPLVYAPPPVVYAPPVYYARPYPAFYGYGGPYFYGRPYYGWGHGWHGGGWHGGGWHGGG